MSDPTSRGSGATPVARAGRRRTMWLWVLIALLLIAALLFALGRCGAGSDPVAAPDAGDAGGATATAPAAAVPPAAPTPADAPAPDPDPTGVTTAAPAPPAAAPTPGAAAGAGNQGALVVGDVPLLPVAGAAGPDGSLSGRAGEQVTADGVTVLSVPADEGFWVGNSDTDRVWVQLVGEGESAYNVRPGDRVEFDGVLVAHDAAFAGAVGVDPGEGADLLARHGAHVEVRQPDLRGASR